MGPDEAAWPLRGDMVEDREGLEASCGREDSPEGAEGVGTWEDSLLEDALRRR